MKQEDKAKRYDELLLKLQKAKVDDNVCDEMYYRVIDDIVPELKESEDEKIRKELICFLETEIPQCNARDKYIAWLEKQGEQKQDPCEHCADKRLNCHNFPCVKGRAFKQGKSVLEAINEEKVDNANKVEPKFKDGDVLNSPSHHLIWIYKDNEHFYACVNMNYVTENVATNGLIKIPSDACPANKLQRDILFSNIKEAGYEWDADKKELKKIEQKSVEWSEEDEKMLNSSVDNLTELMLKYGERYGNVGKCIDWLKSLRPHSTWKPSDKQINAIRLARSFVTDDFGANPTLSDTLVELEKQLKKLKGGVKLCYI